MEHDELRPIHDVGVCIYVAARFVNKFDGVSGGMMRRLLKHLDDCADFTTPQVFFRYIAQQRDDIMQFDLGHYSFTSHFT